MNDRSSYSPYDISGSAAWGSPVPAVDARHPSLTEAELSCLAQQRSQTRHDSAQDGYEEKTFAADSTGGYGVVIREFPAQDRLLNIEKMRAEFREAALVWEQSRCRRMLMNLLLQIVMDKGLKYRGAICAGLGSFSRVGRDCRIGSQSVRRRIMLFAAFLDVAAFLKQVAALPPPEGFRIVFQEKHCVFTDLDTRFLKDHGVIPYIVQYGEPMGGHNLQEPSQGPGEQFVFETVVAKGDGFYSPLFDVNPPLLISFMLFDHVFVDWCRRQPQGCVPAIFSPTFVEADQLWQNRAR